MGAEAGRSPEAARRELHDVASDLQDRGLQATRTSTATPPSRLGISVSAIDDALYDAFGQRLISTIYTQANQYRVVLEAAPQYQIGPEALGQIYVASVGGTACRAASGSQCAHARHGRSQVPLSSIATVEQRHTRS